MEKIRLFFLIWGGTLTLCSHWGQSAERNWSKTETKKERVVGMKKDWKSCSDSVQMSRTEESLGEEENL